MQRHSLRVIVAFVAWAFACLAHAQDATTLRPFRAQAAENPLGQQFVAAAAPGEQFGLAPLALTPALKGYIDGDRLNIFPTAHAEREAQWGTVDRFVSLQMALDFKPKPTTATADKVAAQVKSASFAGTAALDVAFRGSVRLYHDKSGTVAFTARFGAQAGYQAADELTTPSATTGSKISQHSFAIFNGNAALGAWLYWIYAGGQLNVFESSGASKDFQNLIDGKLGVNGMLVVPITPRRDEAPQKNSDALESSYFQGTLSSSVTGAKYLTATLSFVTTFTPF